MLNVSESFRRQRSSLEVNLSWISSSTDSVDNITICNTNNTVSYNTHLKNRSKILENAAKDNELSSKNCKILKVNSLIKTQEILDKQDEIYLERRRILSGKNNGSNRAVRNDLKCAVIQNSSISTFTNKSEDNDRKDKVCQSISSSPKEKYKKICVNKPKESIKCTEKEKYKLHQLLYTTHITIDDVNLKCQDLEQNLLELNGKTGISDHASFILSQKMQTQHFSSHDVLKNKYIPIFVEQTLAEVGENIYPASSQNSSRQLNSENTNIISIINSEQCSLNVNTSDPVAMERNNCTFRHKQENYEEEKCKILENKQKHMCSVVLEGMEESINTICSSLQMNTSLDTLNRLQDAQINTSNSFNTEGNDFVDLNTRSYKLQSPVKIVLDKEHHSGHSTVIHDMTVLSNTVSKELHNTSQTSPITEESIDQNESDINKSKKYLIQFSDKPKRKKKLLPLQECSQLLSFSPIQEECTHPQSKIFKKKQRKKKSKCYKKKSDLNNVQCNETQENRNIPEKKQVRKPRKILSKKIIIKKINNEDMLRRLEINEKSDKIDEEVCTLKRGSSNDFQPLKMSLVLQIPRKPIERINIVVTGFSNKDKDLVKTIVKTLGFAKIGSNVTKHTTHVVTTGMRTTNLLHGIIRGCWLVSLKWILKSFENNTWIDPEKYEMTHFSKAALENRKDRQLFGKSYVPELFAACGYIYIENNTTPPSKVLEDLVKAAGGCITENAENAKILIGYGGLKETWILDSITSGELQPYNHYQQP